MNEEYKKLGGKTFWLFLSQKVSVAIGFFVLAIIFTIVRSLSVVPKNMMPFVGLAGVVCFLIFFVALAVALISSWVVYKSHEYCLGEDALKIKQGVVTKREIAIPYRQIQNVNIERTFSEQMMGLSRLIILTAGEDNGTNDNSGGSEGILPAIDKNLAIELQSELIKRADVEKVIQQPPR